MKPTVGRIVHYHQLQRPGWPENNERAPNPLKTYAAIVTDVWPNGAVDLAVFLGGCTPKGRANTACLNAINFSETPKINCWSWPMREPA